MNINEIHKPFNYIYNLNSGKIRENICMLLKLWYNINKDSIIKINNIINIIHTSSLIIDDIEDNSIKRRGVDCAHIKYGIPLSLNSAYLSIFNLLANESKDIDMVHYTIKCLKKLHIGQGLDILWSNNKYIPSINEYYKMISYKTGALFNLISDLGSLYGNKISDIDTILIFKKIGLFFQIRDDLCDIIDINYWNKKGFFEDLNEGHMSYPIVLCLYYKRDNYDIIFNMLGKNNTFFEKKKAFNILIENNSIMDTQNFLNELKNEIILIDNRLSVFINQIYIPKVGNDQLLKFQDKLCTTSYLE